MEVKVYLNQSTWRSRKPILVRAISCPDAFDYQSAINVLRALFGSDCVIEFLVV